MIRLILNINNFGDEYLVIDFNNLFVASTIEEEILLFSLNNSYDFYTSLIEELSDFSILNIVPDKDINSYSGGEKVILLMSLLFSIIKLKKIYAKKVLLINIIESLSQRNRNILLKKFFYFSSNFKISFYIQMDEKIVELNYNDNTFTK